MFGKKKLDARMDEEFAFHMENLVREYVAKGLTERAARLEARRQFGNALNVRETYRDERGIPWLEDFLADVRYAARLLLRNPGFSFIAILTLALGIGANTAIFSLVNLVYLRQAPYPNAARLVDIAREVRGQEAGTSHNSRRYLYWKERARPFDEVAAAKGGGDLSLIVNSEAEQVRSTLVSENYFRTLGVEPLLGRAFTAQEDKRGAADVAILSWGLWQGRYGGDAGILGRAIQLGGKLATVVGVMGRDFVPARPTDLWMPLQPLPVNNGRNTTVFALLRPGVTREQASKEAGDLIEEYQRVFPGEAKEFAKQERARAVTFNAAGREGGSLLLILFGAVGLTLLIACANLGNLLLARATARVREVAIRATLGAGRGRIVRQLLAESVLIAICGAAVGLALAYALIPGLLAISPVTLPAWKAVRLDWTVLLFTTGIALATGLIFGSLPAWQASRLDLSEAVKDSGGAKASAGKKSGRVRHCIVATEVALSLMLLVGAVLFLRTFANLLSVRTGVDATNVITGQMPLQGERYATTAATAALFRKGIERMKSLPNVESAAAVTNLPMERGLNLVTWIPGTADPDDAKLTDWRYVTPDYFSVLRIPLMAGRMFTESDGPAAAGVVIVNQRFVERYFAGQNPVGRTMQIMQKTPVPDRVRVIVGVVGDVKSDNFRRAAEPTVFVPLEQAPDAHIAIANSFFQASWVVRTRGSAGGFAAVMQRELKALDPLQPFSGFRTLEEVRSKAVKNDRSMTILLGSFALLAVLLAAAGIYGVIAYSVAQRAHEIGIRMALGATAGRVVRSVVGQGAMVAGIGVVVGVAGGLALTRFVAGFVFGVKATDPVTFALAAVSLLVMAGVASLAPAVRVVRMDPVRALRVE